jgi:DNA-binding transcriptional ArsR family regulator
VTMKESDLLKLSDRCEEVSRVLKALSHPVRLKTLCALVDAEKTVNELVDFGGISQSAMSQFLSRLKEEGAVTCRREGTFVYYTLSDPKLKRLIGSLKEIFCK